ncbi:MAG TPA: hypothetical protein VMU77_06340, partial [Acidimicrobiales bacterium]|nr:hypothetical protein [Acidimicrobiales bacterium]
MTTQTYKMLEANWRKIANAAKGIPALGFKTSALIAANSVKTSATRARNSLGTPTSPVQAIGHQESIFIDDDSKTIFSLFSNAQLEVAFVADDVVRIDWRPGTEPVQYATSPFPEWRVGTWSSSLSHQQACISTSKA